MGLATAKRFVLEVMDHVFITGRREDVLNEAVTRHLPIADQSPCSSKVPQAQGLEVAIYSSPLPTL